MIERRPILVTLGVMAAAFGAVLVALVVLDRSDSGTAPIETTRVAAGDIVLRGDEAVAGFLADFERSIDATFRIVAEYTREVDTGLSVTNRFALIQRPPRQLIRTITGTEVGAFLNDSELRELTQLVTGDDSTYTVVGSADGCWHLVLREFVPASPLGTTTDYCFDEATGAPMLVHTSRAEGTDTMVTIEVYADVSDADFD